MPEPPEPADPFAALTAALKALAPNPSTHLIAPTLDWNSTEQYNDFHLFVKSLKSWFTLQNIVKEEKQTQMVPLAQTLHDWSMFSTSWATLAARKMNNGNPLVLQLK